MELIGVKTQKGTDMKNLEYKVRFKIVTPMFIGESDFSNTADRIREASVKGILRFWWRALKWPDVIRDCNGNSDVALQSLAREEGKLFGFAADGQSASSQAPFRLRISHEQKKIAEPPVPTDGHKYLLGQGLCDMKGNYTRKRAWLAGSVFEMRFLLSPRVSENQRKELSRAILALGVLGGVGARSRRGIGSIAIQNFNGFDDVPVPEDATSFKDSLTWLGLPADCDDPPYTAFSRFSRIDISSMGKDPWSLLGQVGSEMMAYRSWRKEKNFPDDHNDVLKAVHGKNPGRIPKRAVFGLPHNYFYKSVFDEKKAIKGVDAPRRYSKADITPDSESHTRRASPLFIHAHQFPDGRAAIVQTLLPALFLPDNVRIEIRTAKKKSSLEFQPNWTVITKFMNRFEERRTILGNN